MPESCVIAFFNQEIGSKAARKCSKPQQGLLSRLDIRSVRWQLIMLSGHLVFHPECCAQTTGSRQTVSVHNCLSNDPIRLNLPNPRGKDANAVCQSCGESPVYRKSKGHGEDENDENEVCIQISSSYLHLLSIFKSKNC